MLAAFDDCRDTIGAHQREQFKVRGRYEQDIEWTGAAIPADVAVHIYEGPRGHGFILRRTRTVLNKDEACAEVHGPEVEREKDWTPIISDAEIER